LSKKLRVSYRTIINLLALAVYCLLVSAIVTAIGETHKWPKVIVLIVCFAIVFAGIGIYNLLKRYVEVVWVK